MKRIAESRLIPNAIQTVIRPKPKIAGMSQFHSHMVGNARIKHTMNVSKNATIVAPSPKRKVLIILII